MRVSFRFLIRLVAPALLAAAHGAAAAVLALAPTAHGGVHVVDVASGNSSMLLVANCCAVQAGSVAADTSTQHVYFLANRIGGVDLHAFGYGANGSDSVLALNAPVRLSHLAFDAPNHRLVGLGVGDDGTVDVLTIDPGTGNVTVTATTAATCCTLRAGVVAYQASSGLLFALGRRSGDTTDQLLAFAVAGGGLQQAYDLGGETVVQLVVDGTELYGLSNAAGSDTQRVGHFVFASTFAFAPYGGGASPCCFALAGPATIDHANNVLVSLGRADSVGELFRTRAFAASGTPSVGNALNAFGLFEDDVVLLDRLFSDGFEGP